MSFTKDTAGKEVLTLGAVIEVLRFVGEKEDLFTVFLIGTTIQDDGKRERSDIDLKQNSIQILLIFFFFFNR